MVDSPEGTRSPNLFEPSDEIVSTEDQPKKKRKRKGAPQPVVKVNSPTKSFTGKSNENI